MDELGIGTLDYLHAPSSNVAADANWFQEALGAELVFAIDSGGVRVAMLRLGGHTALVQHASGADRSPLTPGQHRADRT